MEAKDRITEVLIEALRRALTTPGEQRLYRAGKLDGLFNGRTGVNGDAAEQALALGLLQRSRVEVRGKTEIDWVEITPRGVEFLHQHESPVQALHELRFTLRANQMALPVWLDEMRSLLGSMETRLRAEAEQWQRRLEAIERRVSDTLRRLEAASPLVPPEVLELHPWAVDAINYLDRRQASGAPTAESRGRSVPSSPLGENRGRSVPSSPLGENRGRSVPSSPLGENRGRSVPSSPLACPLPELFTAVVEHHRDLSIASFHDGLKRLRQRRAVELLPCDDPEQMTRPEFALLDGNEVYYLALR